MLTVTPFLDLINVCYNIKYFGVPHFSTNSQLYVSTNLRIYKSMKKIFTDEVSIVFGGSAGQGLQSVQKICSPILNGAGYFVFGTSEYMSRVRGGSNSVELRVSGEKRMAYVERIDILFPLDKDALPHLADRISDQTIIIGDKKQLGEAAKGHEIIDVPFLEAAESVGGKIYLNVVMAAFVLSLFDVEKEELKNLVSKAFAKKGEEVVASNIDAIEKGWAMCDGVEEKFGLKVDISKQSDAKEDIFLDGATAIGIGAVAGGCDFMASYPMSPSTGVFNAVAGLSAEFPIVIEQVEDEIAAANMGLGAWFAGGRAMLSTSGGGFTLMAEAVSLAGMMESPMVFHIAQRPGPATGLPTQTEQGDLNFVLHAGHGEFPRAIFAPGTIEDGINLMQKAFDMADKYQVPVFVLTDKYYMDMVSGARSSEMPLKKYQKYFVETSEGYKRYALTGDGLSPRGIPGFGEGFVCADSDEHEEDGHITESHETRVKMMDKRLARAEMIVADAYPAELVGEDDYTTLIVGWGSTYGAIREAMETAGKPRTAFLHVKQVYPLGEDVREYIAKAEKIIVIENNATGQFADLLTKETGKKVDERILQYDGQPFSVERLVEEFGELF